MKLTIPALTLFSCLLLSFTCTYAQVPEEVQRIKNMDLDKGLATLDHLGYQICNVKPSKKTEDWINQSTKTCITLKFDKKKNQIIEIVSNPNYPDCLKGLDDIRKLWANYHDGQASVTNGKIDEERKKLADAGFKASYWVNDVSPGRTAEYWVNNISKKVKLIVWETQSAKWVMTNESTYSMAKNPSPVKQ